MREARASSQGDIRPVGKGARLQMYQVTIRTWAVLPLKLCIKHLMGGGGGSRSLGGGQCYLSWLIDEMTIPTQSHSFSSSAVELRRSDSKQCFRLTTLLCTTSQSRSYLSQHEPPGSVLLAQDMSPG